MRPLFGWGAASFPLIYSAFKNINVNDIILHSHNLFFELSINYGLIVSLLLLINILIILKSSLIIIFSGRINKHSKAYKAWFIATLIALFTQTFDVTYYDIRISLLFWILFAGLRSINKENSNQHFIETK